MSTACCEKEILISLGHQYLFCLIQNIELHLFLTRRLVLLRVIRCQERYRLHHFLRIQVVAGAVFNSYKAPDCWLCSTFHQNGNFFFGLVFNQVELAA